MKEAKRDFSNISQSWVYAKAVRRFAHTACLLTDIHSQTVFLNDYGEAFRDNKLGDRVKRYLKNAGIQAPGSCHLLRNALVTHMLENGAELRFIQAMLGHADLRATQIYTRVSIRKLQEIHPVPPPGGSEKEQVRGRKLGGKLICLKNIHLMVEIR